MYKLLLNVSSAVPVQIKSVKKHNRIRKLYGGFQNLIKPYSIESKII
jgi:hypothetical protein